MHSVICDMKRDHQALTRQRDAAVKMLISTRNDLLSAYQPLDSTLAALAAFLKVIYQERKESDACTEERQG